jgi:hydrogenase-4 membrane subunit HyfE
MASVIFLLPVLLVAYLLYTANPHLRQQKPETSLTRTLVIGIAIVFIIAIAFLSFNVNYQTFWNTGEFVPAS